MKIIEVLDCFVSYNPETGDFLWIRDKARSKKGSQVGWMCGEGYRRTKFNGKTIFLHRLAWECVNGIALGEMEIDHIDGNRSNNKISNLRPATKSQNMHNSKIRKNNNSGVKGVNWCKDHGKYHAQLMINSRKINVGYFHDLEDAKHAVMQARMKLHKEFSRHV